MTTMTNPLPKSTHRTIAALDIGSSKVACFIAQNEGATTAIKGIGQYASVGMQRGEVVDLETLSLAVGKAVELAESMAGIAIESATVSVSGGEQQSLIEHVALNVDGVVNKHDLNRLLSLDASNNINKDKRTIIHRMPLHYTLDGAKGIRSPLGMHGKRLGVDLAMITALKSTLDNLTEAIERNHFKVDRFCSASYAAGLATLVEDEKDLGAIVINLGAGKTSVAVFMDGQLVHVDSVPIGGHHVTSDIAKGLLTPIDEAERIKTLYGSVLSAIGDTDELLTIPQLGALNSRETGEPQQVELGLLGEIIRPRIEEIFEMLILRLEASGFRVATGLSVVLTGGAAETQGLSEYLQSMFGRNTRIGTPLDIVGMADATRGPAFASTAGLLHYATQTPVSEFSSRFIRISKPKFFGRIGEWFGAHI